MRYVFASLTFAVLSSPYVLHKETNYKILMFWYRNPKVLYTLDQSIPKTFWQLRTSIRFFISHIFSNVLYCILLQVLQQEQDVSLALDPLHCLLGLPFLGLPKYAKYAVLMVVK